MPNDYLNQLRPTRTMQTEATNMACLLNMLSYRQQEVVRYIVEILMTTGATEPVMEILSQTSFLSDLATNQEATESQQSSNSDSDYNESDASSEA
ncbi:hypothetical protein VNI00_015246 [Paramarasmius palmivorus]|uniref:Uncharacterized protein n=1 Tax=Paramarasmius palmivorus TaxID=297713 RepID=A0AAW0BM47_9AGAR